MLPRRLSPRTTAAAALLAVLLSPGGCGPGRETSDVILATTTSTQDSGLLDTLVPVFERETGYVVKTVAVGTGEALAMGARGDADVVLVHAPEEERRAVAEGFAVNRRLVMHNDFLIVGAGADPAGIRGSVSGTEALRRIAEAEAPFLSRGDHSGTHIREIALWEAAGVDPSGDWYVSAGQGMGATLMIAAERGAYALTDRATQLAMRERTGLVPLFEGDPRLLNVYSVMEVNPERFPRVNPEGARAFSDFLLSPSAQEIIRDFGSEAYGEPLFFPDAGRTEDSLGGPVGERAPSEAGSGP
jgi:tungstate transport system substrate-binding protein